MEPTNFALSPHQQVIAPEHVLMQKVAGQSALLNLKSERYFGLDEIGTRMWTLLISSPSIEQACQQLGDEYEVEPDVLRRDVTRLIEQLIEHDLVQIADEKADEPSDEPAV